MIIFSIYLNAHIKIFLNSNRNIHYISETILNVDTIQPDIYSLTNHITSFNSSQYPAIAFSRENLQVLTRNT